MMSLDFASASSSRVIVVANEKGGSGKSTIAMHLAIGLMKAGQRVATIDLDSRQRSFTHYVDNRLAWSRNRKAELAVPTHLCFDEDNEFSRPEDEGAARTALSEALIRLGENHDFIIADTAGHRHLASQLIHTDADVLVTPINDSFVDLDVLACIDPERHTVTGISHYADAVLQARLKRQNNNQPKTAWYVVRNRLSSLASRNKRNVGEALRQLGPVLDFRCVDGITERVMFREFYLRGLTAIDDLKETTLGDRATLSHLAAQMEVQALLHLMILPYQPAPQADHATAA
jgi:chromosome partitioning protein